MLKKEFKIGQLFGGIEAGGTKFVCLVGTGPDEIREERRFPTAGPDETIAGVISFFTPYVQRNELAAVGIGSFGPVDLDPGSPHYGYITTTPKAGWQHVDVRGRIQHGVQVPVAFDTDVNAAAFGEQYWIPENRAIDPLLYMTVGTGIGVGIIINGKPLHGLVHCEAGHLSLPHDWVNDPFPGICPYHGDCLEGLASGPAMHRRWGQPAETLPASHPAWDLEAGYLARALADLVYVFSPRRIILGGGVAQYPDLHRLVRQKVRHYLNGYIQSPLLVERIDSYIQPPGLGNRSGVLGALAMAKNLVKGK